MRSQQSKATQKHQAIHSQTYVQDIQSYDLVQKEGRGAKTSYSGKSRRLAIDAQGPLEVIPPLLPSSMDSIAVHLQLPHGQRESISLPRTHFCRRAQVLDKHIANRARSVAHSRFEAQHRALLWLITDVQEQAWEGQKSPVLSPRHGHAGMAGGDELPEGQVEYPLQDQNAPLTGPLCASRPSLGCHLWDVRNVVPFILSCNRVQDPHTHRIQLVRCAQENEDDA